MSLPQALTYEGMSHSFELALEEANYALTALFTAEMLLKLAGLGMWEYASSWFNVFDFCIVTVSL